MIEWSETDLMIRDSIKGFIDQEIRPTIDELEHGDLPPYEIIRKMFTAFGIADMARDSFFKTIAREKAKAAALAAGEELPPRKKKSGGGMPMSMAFVAFAEICKVAMGVSTAAGVSVGMAATTIMSRGTTAQKERWALDLLTFDKVGSWAITEPDAGSDAFGGMRTSVKRDGADYILNGQKTFITNGPYADTLVVYAKLDDGTDADKRTRPVLTFVLDQGMEGLTQSKPFRKMGMHSSPTGQLFFDNVRVGKDRLLGETEENKGGDGRDSARANFVFERVGVGAMSLGIIEECQRLSIDYAKSRELWGKRIGDFQLIQLKLAKMEIARINVQNMVFRALEMGAAGTPLSLAEASAIKLYSSEAATDVAMDAVQLFGGNGYMSEYRVEQLARDAKSLMIYAGSNEVQVTHIAKGLLGR
ncbi:MAG: putative ACYL-CoA [Nocardia sp.]|uniref:acyl-CoA dehydrogenase family protein n=1 Tax=Nocardia sp. TaxID=1821 RepID=UPI00262601CF|nr:acyl-CoA dehydrogenase family protein [Nocardia sp.]MCU1639868.1 putative ACYL-CoA [Nocardia sp.]